MSTSFYRLTPLDPELLATDHFYFADHADELEQIQWEATAEEVARFNRAEEMLK